MNGAAGSESPNENSLQEIALLSGYSLPVGSNHRVQAALILRRQSRLPGRRRRKARHRLHEILDVAVQQDLPIARLELLDVIAGVGVPVADGEPVLRSDDAHLEAASDSTEPELVCGHVAADQGDVRVAGRGVVLRQGVLACV